MDIIQRKLDLIDAQLTGRTNIHERIIATAPLLFAALGLIAGIMIQSALFEPRVADYRAHFIWFWLILLVLGAAVAILFFAIQRGVSPQTLAYTAFVCFVCLGAVRLTTFYQPKTNDIRSLVTDQRKLATIRGLIVTEPYINKLQNWQFVRFMPTDPTSSFYLKLYQVEAADAWADVTGAVRVQVDEPVLDLKAGDYIQAYCWLDTFKGPTNPGQFNIARYLARRNVFVAASVKLRDSIELLPAGPAGFLTKLKSKVRQIAAQALLGDISPEGQSYGLLEALLLGYRRNIDSNTYRAFRTTGLLHFISLSGMHLGILMGIAWWLCKVIGLMKRARAVVCIIALCIFLLIVPPRAPTLRAAIICFVFCASFFLRRRPNSLNTLSLAAIILLLIRPNQLFEPGWQLSFASVLGILLFCRPMHFFLYEKIAALPWCKKATEKKPFYRMISRPAPYLLALFTTGLTAWLGGAGILLYHFHTINALTSIWTIVAFPFVTMILAVGFLKMILALLLPTAATVLGILVTGLADLLIRIVCLMAHLDISQVLIGKVPGAVIVFYYGMVLFIAFGRFRRPLIKKAISTAMVLMIVVFLGAAKWQRTHRDNLVLTCLDVAHGQAILVRLPGKANVLFDAGSLHKSDVGGRIVTPFLDCSGINKIDAIVISHGDTDHINGIPEIVQNSKVAAVLADNVFLTDMETGPRAPARFLKERLLAQGRQIRPLGKELTLSSSARVRILWPGEQIYQHQHLSDNDKSLVSLIEFAGTGILLCSDIEKFAQAELLRLFPNLKARIVVAPHHGSAETLEPAFLKNLGVQILICSCGRSAYEKQRIVKPDGEVKSFYTARDGAITVRISKDGAVMTGTFKKK